MFSLTYYLKFDKHNGAKKQIFISDVAS